MTNIKKLKIGSRESKLALVQSEWVRNKLLQAQPDLEIEIIKIKTQGDIILDTALSKIGDKALFTKELENKLIDETIDLAVHSMKDLPTVLPEGLEICATSEREDVRDVACFSQQAKADGICSLDSARTIATSSLRRTAQLKSYFPKARFVDIRGNLQTRFKKLESKENGIDALILAAAGIKRLGEEHLIDQYLDPYELLPAVGQGALAVEIKSDREDLRQFIRSAVNDAETEKIIHIEREFLRTLEGGCQVPIGVYCEYQDKEFLITGLVSNLDGSEQIVRSQKSTEHTGLGQALAQEMIESGASDILKAIR
jgi:hydroxymethylbilane synthase